MEATAQAARSAEFRQRLADHYDSMKQVVVGLVRASFGPDLERQDADPEVLASFFIAVYDGFVLQTLLDPRRVPEGSRLIASLRAIRSV